MRLLAGPQTAYLAYRAAVRRDASFTIWDALVPASSLADIYRFRKETVRLAGLTADSYRLAVDRLTGLGDEPLRLGVVRRTDESGRFVLFVAADASPVIACVGGVQREHPSGTVARVIMAPRRAVYPGYAAGMAEPPEYSRYRQDVGVLRSIGAHLASDIPYVECTIPGDLAAAAVAAWERDEEGPIVEETSAQTRSRLRAGDLALLGLAVSRSGSPGDPVVLRLPVAQFAAAVEAWSESQ